MPHSTLITRNGRQYVVDGRGVRPLRQHCQPIAVVTDEVIVGVAREKEPTSPEPEDIFSEIEKRLGHFV